MSSPSNRTLCLNGSLAAIGTGAILSARGNYKVGLPLVSGGLHGSFYAWKSDEETFRMRKLVTDVFVTTLTTMTFDATKVKDRIQNSLSPWMNASASTALAICSTNFFSSTLQASLTRTPFTVTDSVISALSSYVGYVSTLGMDLILGDAGSKTTSFLAGAVKGITNGFATQHTYNQLKSRPIHENMLDAALSGGVLGAAQGLARDFPPEVPEAPERVKIAKPEGWEVLQAEDKALKKKEADFQAVKSSKETEIQSHLNNGYHAKAKWTKNNKETLTNMVLQGQKVKFRNGHDIKKIHINSPPDNPAVERTDLNRRIHDYQQREQNYQNALKASQEQFRALHDDYQEKLRASKEENTSLTDPFPTNWPPSPEKLNELFFQAAERGQVNRIVHLFNCGANPNAKDRFDRTPLYHTVTNRHVDATIMLIRLGANWKTGRPFDEFWGYFNEEDLDKIEQAFRLRLSGLLWALYGTNLPLSKETPITGDIRILQALFEDDPVIRVDDQTGRLTIKR